MLFTWLLLNYQVVFGYFVIIPVVFLMNTSPNAIELVIAPIHALVLDELDNMGSLVLFNWLNTTHNKMANGHSFMHIQTSMAFETAQIPFYLFSIVFFYLNVYAQDLIDLEEFREMVDESFVF